MYITQNGTLIRSSKCVTLAPRKGDKMEISGYGTYIVKDVIWHLDYELFVEVQI